MLRYPANILTELTGKQVTYTSPTAEVFTQTLLKAGVPTECIGFLSGFSEAIKQDEFETYATDLEKLIGQPPVSLKQIMEAIYTPTK